MISAALSCKGGHILIENTSLILAAALRVDQNVTAPEPAYDGDHMPISTMYTIFHHTICPCVLLTCTWNVLNNVNVSGLCTNHVIL